MAVARALFTALFRPPARLPPPDANAAAKARNDPGGNEERHQGGRRGYLPCPMPYSQFPNICHIAPSVILVIRIVRPRRQHGHRYPAASRLTVLLATDDQIADAKGSRDEILGKRADLTDAVYSRISMKNSKSPCCRGVCHNSSVLVNSIFNWTSAGRVSHKRSTRFTVEASYLPCGSYGAW